jgi:hypothetical protein
MKGEERMICHFYRDNWPCKVCNNEPWLSQARSCKAGAVNAAAVLSLCSQHAVLSAHTATSAGCPTCKPSMSWRPHAPHGSRHASLSAVSRFCAHA